MIRAKFTVSNIPFEVEADTKIRLEEALEAALNVAMRINGMPRKTHRESETPATPSLIRESPPTNVGGDIPPMFKRVDTQDADLYEGAKFIADYIRIALTNLGELHGTDRGYSTQEILAHLIKTGGNAPIKSVKSPIGAVGQAIRNSDDFVRKDTRTWLREWVNEVESEPQQKPEENPEASQLELKEFVETTS